MNTTTLSSSCSRTSIPNASQTISPLQPFSFPGGTVYVWATAEEGYEITGYAVDKPAFVSGSLAYDEENGYIAIEGVTGSLTLRVTATPLPTEQETEPAGKTDPAPDPEPETGTTTKPDAPTTADGDARKEPAARQTDSEGTAKKNVFAGSNS